MNKKIKNFNLINIIIFKILLKMRRIFTSTLGNSLSGFMKLSTKKFSNMNKYLKNPGKSAADNNTIEVVNLLKRSVNFKKKISIIFLFSKIFIQNIYSSFFKKFFKSEH